MRVFFFLSVDLNSELKYVLCLAAASCSRLLWMHCVMWFGDKRRSRVPRMVIWHMRDSGNFTPFATLRPCQLIDRPKAFGSGVSYEIYSHLRIYIPARHLWFDSLNLLRDTWFLAAHNLIKDSIRKFSSLETRERKLIKRDSNLVLCLLAETKAVKHFKSYTEFFLKFQIFLTGKNNILPWWVQKICQKE